VREQEYRKRARLTLARRRRRRHRPRCRQCSNWAPSNLASPVSAPLRCPQAPLPSWGGPTLQQALRQLPFKHDTLRLLPQAAAPRPPGTADWGTDKDMAQGVKLNSRRIGFEYERLYGRCVPVAGRGHVLPCQALANLCGEPLAVGGALAAAHCAFMLHAAQLCPRAAALQLHGTSSRPMAACKDPAVPKQRPQTCKAGMLPTILRCRGWAPTCQSTHPTCKRSPSARQARWQHWQRRPAAHNCGGCLRRPPQRPAV
jgi:hypothetical protein